MKRLMDELAAAAFMAAAIVGPIAAHWYGLI
jgi:hypothetical protein